MKIAKITYSDKIFRTVLKKFEITKIDYCNKNLIDFYYEDVNVDYKFGWQKIILYKKYLDFGYDYVWISDYDSVINNQDYNILEILNKNKNKDGIVSVHPDKNMYLFGSAILSNSAKVKFIINEIYNKFNLYDKNKDFFAEESILNEYEFDFLIDNNVNCIYGLHDIEYPFLLHYAGVSNPYSIKQLHEAQNRKK